MAKRGNGWIGIAIVAVGIVVALAGTWYWLGARPKVGQVLDTIDLGDGHTVVVRNEEGGSRNFLELRKGDTVIWQALIPHYAGSRGRLALAWSSHVVTVRVERDGRAEVWALALGDSAKIGQYHLASEHQPIHTQPTGPITLTDHVRSYEIVGGDHWHAVYGVDIDTGKGRWQVDLGPAPIDAGGVEAGQVWIRQGTSVRRFDGPTGREEVVTHASN